MYSSAIEKFAEMKLMHSFLHKGIIMNSTALDICNDDEYIGQWLYTSMLYFVVLIIE